jgi:hypothetical protein
MTLQVAEKRSRNQNKRQGMTSQAAEKPNRSHHKRQGTTSVVPQTAQNKCRALAPAERFSSNSLEIRPFSAACSVVPQTQQKKDGLQPLQMFLVEFPTRCAFSKVPQVVRRDNR